MAIVYQHIRRDTQEVFYVGIGADQKRAYSRNNRNKYWHNVVNKVGYDVEVTHKDLIWEEACSIEKYLVAFWGRKDLGLGSLVNMTDGGEGNANLSESSRKLKGEKISKQKLGVPNLKLKGRIKTVEHREKIATSLKGTKHSDEVNAKKGRSGAENAFYGKTHTEESKQKNRLAHIGKTKTAEQKKALSVKMKGVKKGPQEAVECPHCKKVGGVSNMKRYHFEACKHVTFGA